MPLDVPRLLIECSSCTSHTEKKDIQNEKFFRLIKVNLNNLLGSLMKFADHAFQSNKTYTKIQSLPLKHRHVGF